MNELEASPLGKQNTYADQYDPSLLFAISRDANRESIGINIKKLPFTGTDIWNGFDFTWLDTNGLAHFGVLTIYVPCESPNLIESKSLKLYLFSLANTPFISKSAVINILEADLSVASGAPISVVLEDNLKLFTETFATFSGKSLDQIDAECLDYQVNSNLLECNVTNIVNETLCSDLLKSNCLVTGNPDWASVRITYEGPKIDNAGLLKYLVSYRNHQGFHEQCIEHIYFDILTVCKPSYLLVEGRYTRRGGLDINPVRSNIGVAFNNTRLYRQ